MNTFREQPNCFPITLSRSCGVGALFCSLLHPPGLFLLLLLLPVVVVVVVVIIFLLRSSILPERARGRTANLTSEAHRLLQRGHQSARRRICDEGKNVVGSIHQISRRPNERTKERTNERKIAAGKQIMVRQMKGGRAWSAVAWQDRVMSGQHGV